MKFGKVIRLEGNLAWNEKWVDYYLDYKGLKQMLKDALVDGKLAEMETFLVEFKARWKREVQKVDSFLKREIEQLHALVQQNENDGSKLDHDWTVRRSLALKRLAKFSDVNHEGMQKILKKILKHSPEASEVTNLDNLRDKVFQMRSRHVENLAVIRTKIEDIAGEPVLQDFDQEVSNQLLDQVEVEEDVPLFKELALEGLAPGKIHKFRLAVQQDEMGEWIAVPVLVAKGKFNGPVLGITSALHGNELNGIPLIFRLFREIDVDTMAGTLVAIPVLNPPGYGRRQRNFHDGQDLNRLFPGKLGGNCGQVFCHNVVQKILKKFDYHIDLHTASFGRVNSLYVRADMRNPLTHTMAMLQHPQIVVHNTAPDGSLRSAAMSLNIPSITVEIGDPLQFHNAFVVRTLFGVENVLKWLNMQTFDEDEQGGSRPSSPRKSSMSSVVRRDSLVSPPDEKTTVCTRSSWIYSRHGGVLRVKPAVNTWVEKDQVIAIVQDLFGSIVHTYRSPADGIVVGKSSNPICSTGDRIIHLGYLEASFPEKADDGHT